MTSPESGDERVSGARRWTVLLAVLAALSVAAVVGISIGRGDDGRGAPGRSSRSPSPEVRGDGPLQVVTLPAFAPEPGTDGAEARLASVAAYERTFVAVGWVAAAGRSTPLILRSSDLGATWTRATISGPQTVGDIPITVSGGPRGWVAMGSGIRGSALWTSRDGGSWQRHRASAAAFTEKDSVSRVHAVPEGFLAVGDVSPDVGDPATVLWSSADGVRWQRRTSNQLGIPPQRRGSYGTDVAVRGRTVVIAAGESDQAARVKNNIAFYVSNDGGRRFNRARTPLEFGGVEGRGYVTALVASGNGFTAVGVGGSPFEGYDPVVLTSRDGFRWNDPSPRELDLFGDDGVYGLAVTRGGFVAVGNNDENGLVVGTTAGKWTRQHANDEPLNGPGQQLLQDVAAIDDVVVAVGSDNASGDRDALLLRRQGSGDLSAVSLGDLESAGEPASVARDVTATSDGWVAVGTSAGTGGAWHSADGQSWERVDEGGGALGGLGEQSLTGVTAQPGSSLLVAAGNTDGLASAKSALLVAAADGRTFAPVSSDLPLQGPNKYADRVLTGVAATKSMVVAVGHGDEGGAISSAFPLWSTDGKAFHAAVAARPAAAKADDLAGSVNRDRRMMNVAAGARGFIAVGTVETGSSGTEVPAAWHSLDGKAWRLVSLPAVRGFSGGTAESVTWTGRDWVATGTARSTLSEVPVVWSSADGTRWGAAVRLPLPVGRRGHALDVAGGSFGAVVVGRTFDAAGDEDAILWRLTGSKWAAVSLGSQATGDGQQSLTCVSAKGDVAIALGATITTADVRTLVVRVP